jgi:photosystem II stability/assembly factor-like uncharacterized protein
LESAPGDRDNPDAAYRYRYAILAGNQQNVDFQQRRREAVSYTNQKMKSAKTLRKTSASTWSALGPGNIGGRVRSIVINPANSDQILIGSVSGGIWKSNDGGASWIPKSDTADVMAIGSMVIDPIHSNVVYAGTGEGWLNEDAVYGGGIYKTTDFGETWTLLPSTIGASVSDFRNVLKMAADPSGNIYAATKDLTNKYGGGEYTYSGGLFMSTNGGTSWAKISSADTATNYFNPCDVIPVSPTVIVFAVESNGSTLGGIYRTTDGGTTWSKITSNLPTGNYGRIAFAQDPNNSNTLLAVFESLDLTTAGDGGLKGIFKSTDAGATWAKLTTPQKIASTGGLSYLKDQGWYGNVIAVDPFNSNNIYAGGVDLMKSTDGGSSWSQLSFWDPYYGEPYVHCDHHAIVFDKNNDGTIIEGDDGGVYKTTDAGLHWASLNNGLAITQFYSGAVFANGSTYYGGTQDNGHLKYSGSGSTWTESVSGDGGYTAQDQTNSLVSYEEYVYLTMAKTTDGGVTWNNCVSGLSDANNENTCLFIAPFAMNPENSSVLIAGSNRVWVTNNSAASWTAASNVLDMAGALVSAVAIVNISSTYLAFAGTSGGKIFLCANLNPAAGVNTWTDISPPGNNGAWVRRITIDLNNKNRLFACYGGYNVTGTPTSRHVWYSTDQGRTWSDISQNLPNVPVHSLVIDPNSSSTQYVGTETGVYQTTNNGTAWSPFNSGMPFYVPTDELVIQNGTKALFAFTHGRGVFSTAPSSNVSPGWTVQNSGINTNLASVKAVSPLIAWTAGNEAQVLTTTNGGTTWKPVGGGAIGNADIYVVNALGVDTAFVSTTPGASTFIYRTTNAGSTWTNVYNLTGGFIDGIKMIDASNGIAVGDPVGGSWTFLKTTDGGSTWSLGSGPSQVGNEAGWNNSLATFGASDIWFGTSSAKVYRSTDGGTTWSSSPVPFTNSVAVNFSSAQYGLAGSDSGVTVRTTDGGITWVPVSIGGSGSVAGFSGSGSDFFAAEGGSVYRSTNFGATWSASFTGSIGSLNHLDFGVNGSNIYGWTVSAGGSIAAFSGTVSGVASSVSSVPSEFVLDQNYPNPFNPSTKIQFEIPTSSHVSLKIYNALGAEVATLVDNVMNAGTHSVEWNGKNRFNATVASGVYFYRLTAENFVQTKKMLMIK